VALQKNPANEMIKVNYREILKKKKVGIAGVGGLGSNCAVSLARVGLGELIICDFDVVSVSNLNRQYYFVHQVGTPKVQALHDNIEMINPVVKVTAHHIRLDPVNMKHIFRDCDIIIEAFDQAEMKQMIYETVIEEMGDKVLISGMGLGGWGNNNSITQNKFGNLYICGDMQTEVSDEFPPLAPRVCIVANMQANLAMDLLIKSHNGNSIE
jgi:sulfur carrier protein ThiS adenylyltransferase